MTVHFGNVDPSTTLYIPFASYNSDGASVTLTGLAVTDIEIYKNGNTTQRASDAGFSLLDTDGIDFDGITGIHGVSIDLSDNTDAGFYTAGSTYWVVVSSVTIDTQTVNFIAATFTIGYQNVNVLQVSGDSTAADNLEADYDGTGYNKANSTIGTCTTNTDMRGTDNAATASALAIVDANVDSILEDTATTIPTQIAALNDFDPATDVVANVTLVATCTTNTDMRGTDNALLAASAPTNFGDLAITATTGRVTVGTNNDKAGYSISGSKTTLDALNDLSAAQVNTEVDTAISDAALATASALATVDGNVDAIKAKTDQLTFTVANQVDSNAESMNGSAILGNGTSGDLWRGA